LLYMCCRRVKSHGPVFLFSLVPLQPKCSLDPIHLVDLGASNTFLITIFELYALWCTFLDQEVNPKVDPRPLGESAVDTIG
jgi:hypothetical protein